MRGGELTRPGRCGERFTDRNDRDRTRIAGPRDDVAAVGIERGIGEVCV